MKNFSDAEIGITRSDLRRIIEWWYNNELAKRYDESEMRRIEIIRISADAKYTIRFNVLSKTVIGARKAAAPSEPSA